MALSASVLAPLIRAELLARPASMATDNAALTAMCEAIAAAVVTHITTAAVVPALGLISAAPGSPVTGAAVIT